MVVPRPTTPSSSSYSSSSSQCFSISRNFIFEIHVRTSFTRLQPPQRPVIRPCRLLFRVKQLSVGPSTVHHHLGFPFTLLLAHTPKTGAFIHWLHPQRTLQILPVQAPVRHYLLLCVFAHGEVRLGLFAMQRQRDSIVHPSSILLGLVIAQMRHLAVHQDSRLPLVFPIGGPHSHETRRSLA